MELLIAKIVFLLVAVAYGFSNVAKVHHGIRITELQMWLMSIGIVGFIATQFWIQ